MSQALREMRDGRIDLQRSPCDPNETGAISAQLCLEHGALPWREQGGIHIFVSPDPDRAQAILPRLPRRLRPARITKAASPVFDAEMKRIFGNVLTVQAEKRTPAELSCRHWSSRAMAKLCLTALALCVIMLASAPQVLNLLLIAIACTALVLNTALKSTALLMALQRDVKPTPNFRRDPDAPPPDLPKISLLVPLFEEARIAELLVSRLGRLQYPSALLEICLILEERDELTQNALAQIPLDPTMRIITVPDGQLRTKPRAMNYALDFTTGSLIGIYDAEDAPDPDQLYKVARHFQDADHKLACIQGILSFYNPTDGWLARCFTFEYAGWFRMMLPGLAKLGFALPLGGTTLFFRRDILIEIGGWDAHNVTEDADLGIRLARHGYRCEMLNSVTQEEANNRYLSWIKQRSRWLKGYAMTYCVHMRDCRKLWRDLGPWQFLGFQVLFLGTLIAFCVAPVLWWTAAHFVSGGALAPLPGLSQNAIYGLSMLFMSCEAIMASLYVLAARKLRDRPSFAWIISLPLYFALATIAVYKALFEMIRNPFYWSKTGHGFSRTQIPSQRRLGIDFEAREIRNGEVIFESLGRRARIPGLDRLDDGEMFLKRDLSPPLSRKGGRRK